MDTSSKSNSEAKTRQTQSIKLIFEDKREQDNALNELTRRHPEIEIRPFKTSYSKYAIELFSSSRPIDLSAEFRVDYLLNNNFTSADHIIYNFGSLFRSFVDSLSLDSNNNNKHSQTTNRDLKFLISKLNPDTFCAKVAHSVSVIEKSLRESSADETCISFNGGKDCCVVLYLMYACALRLGGARLPLKVVILSIANSFPELDEFIYNELRAFYADALDYVVLDDTTKTIKQRLFELKSRKPRLVNILMGTRRSDGAYFHSLGEFAPTDVDWPPFVRVNPILDWSYSEIWLFIRWLKLPYCELYNRGYTSIDCSRKTAPNPALFDAGRGEFLPAYFLRNDELERNSRTSSKV